MAPEFDWTIIVERIKKGDEEAFRFLYEKTKDFIYHQIRFEYGFSEQDSEDLLQDVYAAVFQNIGRLNNPNAIIVWISQICKNRCNEQYRKTSRRKEIAEVYTESELSNENEEYDDFSVDSLGSVNNVEEYIEQQEVKRLIGEMISELSQDQQICIVMRMQQYSIQEIAEQTGMKENTVKTNIRRAKEKVRTKVLELEKKGTKLYGLAPVPFFWWLLRKMFVGSDGVSVGMSHADNCFARTAAINAGLSDAAAHTGEAAMSSDVGTKTAARTKAAAGTGSPAVSAGTASNIGIAGTAVGKTALGGFFATTIGKIAVILTAGIIVVGGVIAGVIISNNNVKKSPGQEITNNAPEKQTVAEKSPEEIRQEINAAFLQFVNSHTKQDDNHANSPFKDRSYYSLEYGDDGIPPMIFYKWVEPSFMGETGISLGIYDQGEIISIDDAEVFCQYFEGADSSIAFSSTNGAATEDMHTEFIKFRDDPSIYVFWRKTFGTNYLDQYEFSDGKFHLVRRIDGATSGIGVSGDEVNHNNQEEIDRLLEQNDIKYYLSLTHNRKAEEEYENGEQYWGDNKWVYLNVIDDPYMYISPKKIKTVLDSDEDKASR